MINIIEISQFNSNELLLFDCVAYVQSFLRLLDRCSDGSGFGNELDVPAVKKSSRDASAGESVDKCLQSQNGFAAT